MSSKNAAPARASRAERTRRRILEAARELLESGASSASMGEIAHAAGVTRQLLYVRFDSRADLLLELSRMVDAEVRTPQRQSVVDDAPDAGAALREAVALQGRIKPELAGVADAIDRLRPHDDDAASAWAERESARLDRCRAVIDRLDQDGVLDPVWTSDEAARLLWATTSQRAWRDLVVDGDWSTQQWVECTTRLLERALTTSAPRPTNA